MTSKQVVYMNQGQGETSYARNSGIQNAEQKRLKLMIEAAIAELCSSTSTGALLPTKIAVADLGCSSGPNAVALVSIAIDAIYSHCLQFLQPPPEVCVFLNDLPDNDFNTVVKSLVTLRQSKNKPIVVTAGVVLGSFYERLFTSGSLHLVCSSNSLHWLSKAPEDLTRNQIPAYDIDEHTRLERHPMVIEAYAQQFRKDFTSFLRRPNGWYSVTQAQVQPVVCKLEEVSSRGNFQIVFDVPVSPRVLQVRAHQWALCF